MDAIFDCAVSAFFKSFHRWPWQCWKLARQTLECENTISNSDVGHIAQILLCADLLCWSFTYLARYVADQWSIMLCLILKDTLGKGRPSINRDPFWDCECPVQKHPGESEKFCLLLLIFGSSKDLDLSLTILFSYFCQALPSIEWGPDSFFTVSWKLFELKLMLITVNGGRRRRAIRGF